MRWVPTQLPHSMPSTHFLGQTQGLGLPFLSCSTWQTTVGSHQTTSPLGVAGERSSSIKHYLPLKKKNPKCNYYSCPHAGKLHIPRILSSFGCWQQRHHLVMGFVWWAEGQWSCSLWNAAGTGSSGQTLRKVLEDG